MPLLQTIDQAMLHAPTALPILGRIGGGQVALVDGRHPWRSVGLDNAIYVLRQANGRMLSLRVPLPDAVPPSLGVQYAALANDARLAPLRASPGSPIPLRAAWYADGLALPARDLRSIRHPLVVLDWIDGPTLMAAVDRACRANDRRALAALADAWSRAMALLAAHGFVHGDLAADNAIVRADGSIALIDFDSASWPGGPTVLPARQTPAYAHPGRQVHPEPARRDDFAALLIGASLRVLAEQPELRSRFGDPTSEPGGALLWKPSDLANPQKSPVFAEAERMSADVARLVASLRRAVDEPIDRMPRPAALIAETSQSTPSQVPQPVEFQVSPGPVPQSRRAAVPLPPLPSVDVPTRGAPPVAMRPAPHPSSVTRSSPVDPRAFQGVLTQLNAALMAGDDRRALSLWHEGGLQKDPTLAREYGVRIAETEQRQAAARIQAASQRNDSIAVLRLWEESGLDGTQVGRSVYPAVEGARRRVAQAERLRAALATRDRDRVAALWQELRGDPLVSMETARVAHILGHSLTEQLAQALTRQDDRAILAAVADAEAASLPLSPDTRQAKRAAQRREETRASLALAQAGSDSVALAELAISGRLTELGRLDPATVRAAQRAVHHGALASAIAGDDDWVIASVYESQISLYEDGQLSGDERDRVTLAQSRLAWLADVRTALRQRDLIALKALTRSSPPDAVARLSDVERNRIERLSRREVAVRRLQRLLREGSDLEILAALATMKESGAEFPKEFDWATLRAVEERTELASSILSALETDPPDLDQLAVLLPAARAAVEAGNPPAFPGTTLEQIERDILQAARVRRIREAIAAGDDDAIRAVSHPDTDALLTRLSTDERQRVREAMATSPNGR